MRQAIVEATCSLLTELALFNLLLERVLDNSSYDRSKVFAVLAA